ncbi:ribonuclease HI family protein [Gracilibacillus phocaeensis]|uniref:ribonuclease HI family protein n=1 Tax=Gracilibacillus phocaeensis TaxID=2042304 RepID=UPI0010310B64|nr:ribonuclease HI family protein [Gracilibacillus phocaeensis]
MIEVYTDAATRGNPGPSGIGIYMKQGNRQWEEYVFIGEQTNHEAEFIALIKGLQLCQEHFPDEIISCRTDSKVVADAYEKNYAKNKPFQSYLEQINHIAASFSYVFVKWIPEKQNKRADLLARKALNQQGS